MAELDASPADPDDAERLPCREASPTDSSISLSNSVSSESRLSALFLAPEYQTTLPGKSYPACFSDLAPELLRAILEVTRKAGRVSEWPHISSDSSLSSSCSHVCPLERFRQTEQRHELIAVGDDTSTCLKEQRALSAASRPPISQAMNRYLSAEESHETFALRVHSCTARDMAAPPPSLPPVASTQGPPLVPSNGKRAWASYSEGQIEEVPERERLRVHLESYRSERPQTKNRNSIAMKANVVRMRSNIGPDEKKPKRGRAD